MFAYLNSYTSKYILYVDNTKTPRGLRTIHQYTPPPPPRTIEKLEGQVARPVARSSVPSFPALDSTHEIDPHRGPLHSLRLIVPSLLVTLGAVCGRPFERSPTHQRRSGDDHDHDTFSPSSFLRDRANRKISIRKQIHRSHRRNRSNTATGQHAPPQRESPVPSFTLLYSTLVLPWSAWRDWTQLDSTAEQIQDKTLNNHSPHPPIQPPPPKKKQKLFFGVSLTARTGVRS